MVNLRGAPLLRPFLIFGFLGLSLVATFSRINGYKNHWRDVWVGWLIGTLAAIFLVWFINNSLVIIYCSVLRGVVLSRSLSCDHRETDCRRTHQPVLFVVPSATRASTVVERGICVREIYL
jgi:hypothetical protein